MKFYTLTNKDGYYPELIRNNIYNDCYKNSKPNGNCLWASPLNSKGLPQWVCFEDFTNPYIFPEMKEYRNIIEFDVDMSKILVIDTYDKFRALMTLFPYHTDDGKLSFDWETISRVFPAVFVNYHELIRKRDMNDAYYFDIRSYDVDSLIVFDKNFIKSFTFNPPELCAKIEKFWVDYYEKMSVCTS